MTAVASTTMPVRAVGRDRDRNGNLLIARACENWDAPLPPLPTATKLYSIRFHFKNGKTKDMHIRPEDNNGQVNDIAGCTRVMRKVDQILDEHGNYSVRDPHDVTQNFIVYDSDIDMMEIVER